MYVCAIIVQCVNIMDDGVKHVLSNCSEVPSTSEDAWKKRKVLRREREFNVKIEYVATVKMGAILALLFSQRNEKAQTALQVLDIVLRQHSAAKYAIKLM